MSTFMTGDTSGGLKKSSGVSLNEPSITAAWNATREQAAGYVITSYVNGSKTNIDVQESSPIGSWEQLKTALGKFNATACYGGVAAAGKFHHFFYVGPDCAGMARGRACLHKNAVLNLFEGCVGETTITVEEVEAAAGEASAASTHTAPTPAAPTPATPAPAPPAPAAPPPAGDDHDARMSAELAQLTKDISRLGTNGTVPFGTLFDDPEVEQYYEALVGTLKAAKREGLVTFEGQMLLKGAHDAVPITLTGAAPFIDTVEKPASTPAQAPAHAPALAPAPALGGGGPAVKHLALDDAVFEQMFFMDKAAFAKLPKWKQDNAKKKANLF